MAALPGARVHGYEAKPVVFVIEPYFPANAITNFIGASFNTAFAETYAFTSLFLQHPLGALWVVAKLLWHGFLATPLWIRVLTISIYLLYLWQINNAAVLGHLDMGRGGTAANRWGWWRLWRLRFFGSIPSVFEGPHISPFLKPYRGILHVDDLTPPRPGPRPTVRGTAPQRQINQKTSISQYEVVKNTLALRADTYGRDLKFEKSYLEKLGGTMALKVRKQAHDPIPAIKNPQTNSVSLAVPAWSTATPYTSHPKRAWIKRFGYEIAHAHHADGSVHVILHPEDVQTVIDAGYGERHPISSTAWSWLFWYDTFKPLFVKDSRPPVPETFVFLYAPRNNEELQVFMLIVDAAIWYATGEEVETVNGHGPWAKDRYEDELQDQPQTRLARSTTEEGEAEQEAAKQAQIALARANPLYDPKTGRIGPVSRGFLSRFGF